MSWKIFEDALFEKQYYLIPIKNNCVELRNLIRSSTQILG